MERIKEFITCYFKSNYFPFNQTILKTAWVACFFWIWKLLLFLNPFLYKSHVCKYITSPLEENLLPYPDKRYFLKVPAFAPYGPMREPEHCSDAYKEEGFFHHLETCVGNYAIEPFLWSLSYFGYKCLSASYHM